MSKNIGVYSVLFKYEKKLSNARRFTSYDGWSSFDRKNALVEWWAAKNERDTYKKICLEADEMIIDYGFTVGDLANVGRGEA